MYRFFRKQLSRKHKGFTLTELIVVVAVVGLLMACVAAFAQPVRIMVSNSVAKPDTLRISEIVGKYIENKLAYANYVEVYAGYKLNSSTMSSAYNVLKARKEKFELTTAAGNPKQRNYPGIMVLHYEADSSDPLAHTFKLYDIPLSSSAMAFPADVSDAYKVFTDDFYGDYEFFMGFVDTAPKTNVIKRRAYMNFIIEGYNFNGDYSTSSFTADNVEDYYDHLVNPSVTDPFQGNEIRASKTATENVSFGLENIRVNTRSVEKMPPTTPPEYEIQTSAENYSIHMGTDTDVVIFYNVRQYNVKTDE